MGALREAFQALEDAKLRIIHLEMELKETTEKYDALCEKIKEKGLTKDTK